MNHTSAMHLWDNMDDVKSALRSAAFLAAIKRGAHFIFQANPGKKRIFSYGYCIRASSNG